MEMKVQESVEGGWMEEWVEKWVKLMEMMKVVVSCGFIGLA